MGGWGGLGCGRWGGGGVADGVGVGDGVGWGGGVGGWTYSIPDTSRTEY